ncbi:MAG: hypothetical protein ACLUD4_08010 [Thomasclavelia spiroformis]
MKILVITDSLWREDNNVGNSYSNIFGGIKDIELYNISCQQGKSSNTIVKSCYQISEKSIIKSFFGGKSGFIEKEISINEDNNIRNSSLPRFQILFWVRELIWLTSKWKTKELRDYICNISPDLIFLQLADKIYLNRLGLYVKKVCQCPMVAYSWDDIYTLKQFSLSPLFWIDRFYKRKSLRKVIKQCEKLYTISNIQRIEYNKIFKKDCKLLFKGYDFDENIEFLDKPMFDSINFLYTGNIGDNRWKNLLLLAKQIESINNDKIKLMLDIYTASPMTKKIKTSFGKFKYTKLHGKVSKKKVVELQSSADILVHVEPFDIKGMLKSRLSFSTKLVDYFYQHKCIFAIGDIRSASINYLMMNDSAFVAKNKEEIKNYLIEIKNNPKILNIYAKKAYETGIKNHNIKNIQKDLSSDFDLIIGDIR